MIGRAEKRFTSTDELRFHFELREGFGLQLPAPADVAVASYSLGVLPPEKFPEALEEIWRNLAPGGRLLILDQYLPEARGFFVRIYQWFYKVISDKIYHQDWSNRVAPVAERYFERTHYEYRENLFTYAWIGTRRAKPLGSG
jgi:ubiquinone/menaquinone biosynthesis C-methylase UbiE